MSNPNAEIGQRIRDERKRQGLTLEKVGEKVGLSGAYLSQIENGRVNINISHLQRISRVLKVPLVHFFVDGDEQTTSLIRDDQRRWFQLGAQAKESLLIKSRGNLEVFVIWLPPGSDSVEDSHHPGEELTYVLDGQVRMILNSDQVYDLQKGDALYYRSEIPHRWQNPSEAEAELLVVNTPSTY
jgi:transcriptional regulator with XRE-family HTH domain